MEQQPKIRKTPHIHFLENATQALIESSPDFIEIREASARGKILYMNSAGRELLGLPPLDDFTASDRLDMHVRDQSVLQALDEAFVRGSAWRCECDFYHYRTSQPIPVHLLVFPIRDSTGQDTARAFIAHDLRDRKLAANPHQDPGIRTQAMLSAIPDAVFRCKTDGTILYFHVPDPNWRLFLPREELIGAKLEDMRAPESVIRQVMDAIRRASASGVLETVEYAVETNSGVAKFEARIAPSGPEEVVAIVRDITQQSLAERALAEQRTFLRQVMDLDRNLIFAKDRVGRFRLANQATADAYGTTVENLIGKTDTDFNPNAAEVAHFRRDDLDVMDSLDEKVIAEELLTDASGRTMWLRTVKRPIVGADGKADLVLGVATDITESKRAEERMRALAGQLLTAQEEERRRIARELHDDITQKLVLVGLEIDVLRKNQDAQSIGHALAQLHERIAQLTDRIRDVSHTFHPGVLEYSGLAAALEAHCHEVSRQAGIRVDFLAHGLPSRIPSSISVVLYRIAQEALRNSIKHSGATNVSVVLTTILDADDRTLLRLSILDNGKGFHVDEVHYGAGLGLLSIEERARLVHGTLKISSEVGEGTRVEVEVPLPEESV